MKSISIKYFDNYKDAYAFYKDSICPMPPQVCAIGIGWCRWGVTYEKPNLTGLELNKIQELSEEVLDYNQ